MRATQQLQYALYGIFESTRFTPTPLRSAHAVAQLDSIKALNAELRRRLAQRWGRELEGTSVRQATFSFDSIRNSPPENRAGLWIT